MIGVKGMLGNIRKRTTIRIWWIWMLGTLAALQRRYDLGVEVLAYVKGSPREEGRMDRHCT